MRKWFRTRSSLLNYSFMAGDRIQCVLSIYRWPKNYMANDISVLVCSNFLRDLCLYCFLCSTPILCVEFGSPYGRNERDLNLEMYIIVCERVCVWVCSWTSAIWNITFSSLLCPLAHSFLSHSLSHSISISLFVTLTACDPQILRSQKGTPKFASSNHRHVRMLCTRKKEQT